MRCGLNTILFHALMLGRSETSSYQPVSARCSFGVGNGERLGVAGDEGDARQPGVLEMLSHGALDRPVVTEDY
jgi:hypothetical protein